MAGRRPKPLAMHRLNGNPSMLSKAEIDAASNPEPRTAVPEMPKGMPKAARREWKHIVPLLVTNGLLTEVDGLALAAYCQAHALVEKAQKEIDETGITFTTHYENEDGTIVDGDIKANPAVAIYLQALKTMKAFLIEFGLTPASRRNLKVNRSDNKDPMEQYIDRKRPQSTGTPLLTPVSPDEMTADDEIRVDTLDETAPEEPVTPGQDSPTE